ncbi:MAG: Gfo/Idh/MocA family oxidoreductase [Rhodobacteraceae bacterium]|nr:Gfo/Idh/MocA family oxidoreductase [Paracoccaceae bacterium]
MKEPVRLAIAGYGLVGRRHVDAIAQCDRAEVAAVVEPSDAGRAHASDAGFAVFPSLDALLAADRPDGVILATPNSLHVEQATACVAVAIPVLVEKPIATRSEDAEELVRRANLAGVPVLVGHHRRHNPLIQKAKALIDAGEIGSIRAVQATCWFYKPDDYFDVSDWRRMPGAGPISVNLVHDIDLLRYLCGEVSTVRAVARPSVRGYANEDVASALLEFESGAIGTITVSDSIVAPWSWELTSREYPIYPPTPENCYMIGGSHGSLSIPDLRVWNYADKDRNWWAPISSTTVKRETTDPLVNQIENFADVIRGTADPLVTGREGLATLQVVEAIQQSAMTGDCIDLRRKTKIVAAAEGKNI